MAALIPVRRTGCGVDPRQPLCYHAQFQNLWFMRVREATEHGGRSATKRRRTAVNTMAPKLKRTVVILRWLG